jgi:iron complex outermembrane receptor protein
LTTAIGTTFDLRPKLNVNLSYNEGLRAPSPIELTCADPLAPCRLPNNFLADPPLDPMVSKTWKGGVRGQLSKDLEWSAALYRTELNEDIIFVSSGGAINAGFFSERGRDTAAGIGARAVEKARQALAERALRLPRCQLRVADHDQQPE